MTRRALSILPPIAGCPALLLSFGLGASCEARAARPPEALHVSPAGPLALPAPTPAAGLRLRCRLEFPVAHGATPQGILVRDLDGDGRAELVGLSRSPGSLQVSNGYTPTAREIPEAHAVGVGDWGIGPVWLDPQGRDPASAGLVAFAPRSPSALLLVDAAAVRAGKGEEAVRWRTPLERRARVLAAGDLGHDGHPKVLVATVDDDLLLFDGPDSFRKLHLCDEHASCLTVLPGGDGFLVGFQGSRRVVLYQPTKENSFGYEPGPSVELAGLPRKLLVCDFDGDGDDELAVALGDASLWIFGLKSAGGVRAGLAARPVELAVGSVPIDLVDCELDGRPGREIACLSLAAQEFQVFAWQDGAVHSLARGYAGQSPAALACADLDGDGHPDLVFANSGEQRWSVAFGLPGGAFELAQETRTGRAPYAFAVGDLDGDKRPDVVVLNALEGTLSVLRGTSSGLAPAETLIRAPNAESLQLADVDGDGKLDALWLSKAKEGCSICFAFGDGRGAVWQRAAVLPLPVGDAAGDLLAVDLDGDGVCELVVSDPESNLVRIFVRRSAAGEDPRFEEATRIVIPGGPGPLALLDAQGALRRIAVGLCGKAPRKGVVIAEFKKGADGAWTSAAHDFVPLSAGVRALCSADLDGDGRPDLALLVASEGSEGPGLMIPVLARAEGGWNALAAQATGLRPYRIAAADLDGDRRAEILVSAQNSHAIDLWFASKGERLEFVRGPDLGVGMGPLGVLCADLDGDGVPEILCSNHFSDGVSVIRVR